MACLFVLVLSPGFLEAEMGDEIVLPKPGKYPETPLPREMIDLEVKVPRLLHICVSHAPGRNNWGELLASSPVCGFLKAGLLVQFGGALLVFSCHVEVVWGVW